MTDDPTPTTLRRQLGARLRQLRVGSGRTARRVADDLGFSVSKISRIETGDRAVQETDIAALLDYFGLVGPGADEMLDLARQGRRRRVATPQPIVDVADEVIIKQSGFLELEQDAVVIREFNGGVVPGLLQTADYMRAVMIETAPDIEESAVNRAMEIRRRRQTSGRVDRRVEVIIDESVIWRNVGGGRVMKRQLAQLSSEIEAGTADVRIVPLGAGSHPALNSMFVALRVDGGAANDIVFVEGLAGHLKFDRPEDVRKFDRVWTTLMLLADPLEQTVRRLQSACESYS